MSYSTSCTTQTTSEAISCPVAATNSATSCSARFTVPITSVVVWKIRMLAVLACVLLFGTSAEAGYVSRLQGVVELPMLHDTRCSNACPKPSPLTTTVDIGTQISVTMGRNWREHLPYTFYQTECVNGYHIRHVFNGSQTLCDRDQYGLYSCTPVPEHYCYISVKLAFQTICNNRSPVRRNITGRTVTEPQIYNGRRTEQIYMFGTIPAEPRIEFSLECMDGQPCLMDSVTVISLLYSCID